MIGKKLKEFIEIQGVRNKTKLSKELGVSPQLFYKYENDLVQPTLQFIKKVAERFNVSVDYLFSGIGTENENDQSLATDEVFEQDNLAELSSKVSEQIILKLTNTNDKSLDHIIDLGNALIRLTDKVFEKL